MTSLATTPIDHVDNAHNHKTLIVVGVLVLLILSIPVILWWRASQSSAAFADAEVLEANRLGAATLDVDVGEDTITFAAENLAPGDRATGQLEVVNAGSLPLLFAVTGTSDGDPLADWLRFDLWMTPTICDSDNPGAMISRDLALTSQPAVLVGAQDLSGSGGAKLAVGDSTIMCVGARLLLEAPNEVQGRRSEIDLVIDAIHDLEAPP